MTTNSPNPVDGDVQAQPVAWAHRLVNKRNGTIHPGVYGSNEKEPSEGDVFRIEVKPLYDTPPVQLLRSVELPDRYDIASMIDVEKDDDGPLLLTSDVIGLLRSLGYEVKND